MTEFLGRFWAELSVIGALLVIWAIWWLVDNMRRRAVDLTFLRRQSVIAAARLKSLLRRSNWKE